MRRNKEKIMLKRKIWAKLEAFKANGESEYVQISKLGPLINEAEELSRILAASVITARGRRD